MDSIGLLPNTQFCAFQIEGKDYALDIVNIIEIVRHRNATPIPRSPEFIEGYLDLRGAVIPVIDLKKRLELEATEPDKRTRIVILRIGKRVVGFIIEEILDIFLVAEGEFKLAPAITAGSSANEFIKGVYNGPDGMVLIVDIEKVFSTQERSALKSLVTPMPSRVKGSDRPDAGKEKE